MNARGATPAVDRETQRANAPRARRVRNAVVWNKPLRRFIHPADLLVFLCYRLYLEKVEQRVLIADRYFYDTLVDVSDGRRWFWIRLLKWLTPTPHVPDLSRHHSGGVVCTQGRVHG